MKIPDNVLPLEKSFKMTLQTPGLRSTRFLTGWGNYKGEETNILKKLNFVQVKVRSAFQGCTTVALPKKVEEENMICTGILSIFYCYVHSNARKKDDFEIHIPFLVNRYIDSVKKCLYKYPLKSLFPKIYFTETHAIKLSFINYDLL